MNTTSRRKWAGAAWAGALLLGLGLASVSLRGAAPDAPPPKPAAGPETPPPVKPAPTAADAESPPKADLAFNTYVDLRLLETAFQNGDAGGATDAGLQLAEGERVLQRTHLSGVTSRVVLRKALALAQDKQDKATLGRIARAAEKADDKALLAQAKNAQKLADQNRAPDPDLQVSVESLTPETFERFQAAMKVVKDAQLLGDADALKTLEPQLAKLDLPAAQQETLKKMIAQARESLPAKTDAEELALKKLLGPSRGGFLDILRPIEPPTPPDAPGDRGLWFRNDTDHIIDLAVEGKTADNSNNETGVYDPPYWQVSGWYQILPHKTICVIAGDLPNRYYYYYAKARNGGVWEANSNYHYVDPVNRFGYDVASENAVRKKNWVKHGFNKIDTGADNTGFTMTLN